MITSQDATEAQGKLIGALFGDHWQQRYVACMDRKVEKRLKRQSRFGYS